MIERLTDGYTTYDTDTSMDTNMHKHTGTNAKASTKVHRQAFTLASTKAGQHKQEGNTEHEH